jgi:hypothetical protein
MKRYNLEDCPVISDPQCQLFRAYQLPRGTWKQLFGLRVWIEGFKAAILKGYGFGKLVGDGFQMSGAFVVRDGLIVRAYPSQDAADSCSWKPALTAVLAITLGIMSLEGTSAMAQNNTDRPSLNARESVGMDSIEISEVREGDRVVIAEQVGSSDGVVIEVHSTKGIGSCKLIRCKKDWPDKLILRMHTKGLEQIQLIIANCSKTYSGEFNSSRLQESWTEITQETNQAGETKTSSRQKEFESKLLWVMSGSGKEVEPVRLPLEQGQYFQWTVPKAWLAEKNPSSIEIKWVDFFRN